MTKMIFDMSRKLEDALDGVTGENAIYLLSSNRKNLPAISFKAALIFFGEDFFTLENETVQLALLSAKVPPEKIEKVIALKSLLSNYDEALSQAHPFSLLVEAMNDTETHTSLLQFQYSEKIIWALVCIMVFVGAENIPTTRDATRYIVACLKSEGWTMPPLMLGTQKFTDYFEYFDSKIYEDRRCSEKFLLSFCAKEHGDAMEDKGNFYEHHKPILLYLHSKINQTVGELDINGIEDR